MSSRRRHSSQGVTFADSRGNFRSTLERDAIRDLERRERHLREREHDVRDRERALRDAAYSSTVTPMRRGRALSHVTPAMSVIPASPLPSTISPYGLGVMPEAPRPYPGYASAAYQHQAVNTVPVSRLKADHNSYLLTLRSLQIPVPVPVPVHVPVPHAAMAGGYMPGSVPYAPTPLPHYNMSGRPPPLRRSSSWSEFNSRVPQMYDPSGRDPRYRGHIGAPFGR